MTCAKQSGSEPGTAVPRDGAPPPGIGSRRSTFRVDAVCAGGVACLAKPLMDVVVTAPAEPSAIDRTLARLLRPFARIEPDEAVGAVVLAAIVFLLLTAYYLLKTAREPLILLHGGAEVKSYASAGQAALLVLVVRVVQQRRAPRRARAPPRRRLPLLRVEPPRLRGARAPRACTSACRFFSGSASSTTRRSRSSGRSPPTRTRPSKGKRVFAVLGIGSSLGAVVGARIARRLVRPRPAGVDDRRGGDPGRVRGAARLGRPSPVGPASARAPAHRESRRRRWRATRPSRLLRRDRYLLLIAGLTLVLNWVNATGEYMLDRSLLAAVHDNGLARAARRRRSSARSRRSTSRGSTPRASCSSSSPSRASSRASGVKNALLFQPAVSLVGYTLVVFSPMLALIRLVKVGENSIDYSLQNTARQALYLVTSRVEKYVGKTTVDTLFVRLGDVLSACVVAGGVARSSPRRARSPRSTWSSSPCGWSSSSPSDARTLGERAKGKSSWPLEPASHREAPDARRGVRHGALRATAVRSPRVRRRSRPSVRGRAGHAAAARFGGRGSAPRGARSPTTKGGRGRQPTAATSRSGCRASSSRPSTSRASS